MKKSDEVKQRLAALEAENKELVSKEARTADENAKVDEYISKREAMEAELTRELKLEQIGLYSAGRNGQIISPKEEKEIAKYSFHRAITLLSEGKQVDGLEGEMHAEGLKERAGLGLESKGFTVPMTVLQAGKRAAAGQNVGTAGDGGNWVQEESLIFIEALKNAMVLTQMGATFLPGLVGNLPLSKSGAFTASWVAEGSSVTTTKTTASKSTLTPKNLMVAGAVTKQLIRQTGGIAEAMVRNELINAIAYGLQDAAINGSGSGATPTGILNYSGIGSEAGGTNGLAPTWGNIVNLESKVANANAIFTNPAYLTNTKVRGKLKQTLKASGVSGYIWDGMGMNGYDAMVTNSVPSNLDKGSSTGVCSAIIFGYFSELFIGFWGGLDMIVDPYALKKSAEIEIVFNQFADVALRNAEAFAAMKDALTT